MRFRCALALSVALLLAQGCVSPHDPMGHRDALKDAQKHYTNLIRWGDAHRAVEFVDPDLRDKFLAHAADLEDVAISDVEIGEIEYADEDTTAHVDVTYRGYSLSQFVERKIHVTQEWHRISGNDWRVHPDIDTVVAQLRGTPR
jgi:hypothetical protein